MKNYKGIIITVLLLVMLTSFVAFAGTWYSFTFKSTISTTQFTTEQFYNTGSCWLRMLVNPSSVSRTYKIELQRMSISTNKWETMNTWTGSIKSGDVLYNPFNWNNNNGSRGDFRYLITFSSNSTFDGTVNYYK